MQPERIHAAHQPGTPGLKMELALEVKAGLDAEVRLGAAANLRKGVDGLRAILALSSIPQGDKALISGIIAIGEQAAHRFEGGEDPVRVLAQPSRYTWQGPNAGRNEMLAAFARAAAATQNADALARAILDIAIDTLGRQLPGDGPAAIALALIRRMALGRGRAPGRMLRLRLQRVAGWGWRLEARAGR